MFASFVYNMYEFVRIFVCGYFISNMYVFIHVDEFGHMWSNKIDKAQHVKLNYEVVGNINTVFEPVSSFQICNLFKLHLTVT